MLHRPADGTTVGCSGSPSFPFSRGSSPLHGQHQLHCALALRLSAMAEAAAAAPVEVGARGTVGSLVLQEIEYFKKLNLGKHQSPQKPRAQVVGRAISSGSAAGGGGRHRPGFRSPTGRKKKPAGIVGSSFLPSICSAVEIVDSGWGGDRAPRIGYRNLKHEQ